MYVCQWTDSVTEKDDRVRLGRRSDDDLCASEECSTPCTRWVLIIPSALGLKMWCRRFLHYQLFDAVGEVEHECSVRLRDS